MAAIGFIGAQRATRWGCAKYVMLEHADVGPDHELAARGYNDVVARRVRQRRRARADVRPRGARVRRLVDVPFARAERAREGCNAVRGRTQR
jgi:hypothetical protein